MKRPRFGRFPSFGKATIASQIRRIVLLTSGTALLCGSFAYLASEVLLYRNSLVGNLEVLADAVGTNSTTALAFDDPETAARVLQALEAEPAVQGAVLLSADGSELAVFTPPGESSAPPPEFIATIEKIGTIDPGTIGHRFGLRTLHLWRPVLVGGEVVGQVLLWADLAHVYALIRSHALLVATMFLLLMTGVYFWSNGLQRKISQPIRNLTAGMETVSNRQNFALRVEATHDDEIGALIRGFNAMLAQIEQRDRKLEAYRDELEQRVEERTADLLRARDSAEAASRAKSEFLATMSHEIRTPMNGVLGTTELLLNSALDTHQYRLARTAYRSAELLLGVIDNILDFSKIEAGHLELAQSRFELRPLVEDVVALLTDQAQRKGLALNLDIPPALLEPVSGDATRLSQVLINLVGNAVKFTDSGEVRLAVQTLSETDTGLNLRFTVADTGPGIALDRQERIFEPFIQEDGSISRRHGGTGLGLAITRRLLELMGSKLHLDSTPGEGSKFSFDLLLSKALPKPETDSANLRPGADTRPPAVKAELAAASNGRSVTDPPPRHAPTKPARHILLAEDNTVNQEVTLGMLGELRCKIDVVEDGSAAVEAVTKRRYDLVLMDCHMPAMDGFTAAAAIRRQENRDGLPRTPIIALSADVRKGIEAKCVAYGMDAYLSKPFERSSLIQALSRWLPAPAEDVRPPDTPSTVPLPAPLGQVDREILNRLRGIGRRRGRDVLGTVVARYRAKAPVLLDAARRAVGERDAEGLYRAAHSLKSSSASLGATTLAERCAELETAAEAQHFADAQTLLDVIEPAAGEVSVELEAMSQPSVDAETASANDESSGPAILIVDDDPTFRLLASEALCDSGFAVTEADSAAQALACLQRRRPDLVMVDAIMQGMSGFDLCRHLMCDKEFADIPVLMVTGLDDIDSVNQAFEVGASGFTTKPVNFPVLIQQLRFALRANRTEAELREQQGHLEAAQRLGRLGYWHWVRNSGRFEVSEILQTMLDIRDGDDIDGPAAILALVDPADRERVQASFEAALAGEAQAPIEFCVNTAGGAKLEVRQVLDTRLQSGGADHIFGTVQDITRERQAESRIRKLAYFDELTGLASRTYFLQTLEQTIKSVYRTDECFALLFIDLDGFKDVNDSLGHDVGDQLLQIVANRLRDALREGDFVARLGGDEFCVIARNVTAQCTTADVAQRCIEQIGQPVNLLSQLLLPRMSIGIAHYPDDGRSANSLVKAADSAMYAAKHAGKNRYAFYSPEMTRQAEQRLALDNDIRSALDDEQLVLYYQPQVSLVTGRVVGVEALARWRHPQRGTILPGEFIPAVERIGLIDKLGDLVIDLACAQMQRWAHAGMEPLNVSVNVSPLQLRDARIITTLSEALARYQLAPGRLTLEVTETINQNDREALAVLERLNELGVTIAIDDFGTGYSSLGSLKHLPIHCVKIDRVFVRDMLQDADDTVLLGAIIGLARALELTVVVEGVDAYEQVQVLAGIGCEIVQGFYFSTPVAAAEVPALVDKLFIPTNGGSAHVPTGSTGGPAR